MVPDTNPICNMMNFSVKAANCNIIFKIDKTVDILKTAFSTPFGLFEFTRMALRMRNAGWPGQCPHIFIFSKWEEEHC